MGRAILPQDITTWNALLEEHDSFAGVARAFGVSGEAARKAYRKAEITAGVEAVTGETGISLSAWIPWSVKMKHAKNPLYRRRMLYARREAGGELSPVETVEVEEFIGFMERGQPGVHEGPLTLVYWPETRDGFYAVPRRPGDVDGVRVE